MKKKIFTLLIIGTISLASCSYAKKPNCLPKGDNTEKGMYIEASKLGTLEHMDFNKIFGNIDIILKNIPSDANQSDIDKAFIYLDELEIGRWESSERDSHNRLYGWSKEQERFGLESNRFSNGWHRIKLVGVNRDGEVINYPTIDAHFKNLLYNIHCDERFSPAENYHYSGFYDGGKSLEVKLNNCRGEVLWSNTYSGNYIDVIIPASAFWKEQLCSIDVNEVPGGSKETDLVMPDSNKKPTKTGIEFFQADKYFVPPTDGTLAILLCLPYSYGDSYQPLALFGDKKLAEKLMGKSLEPKKIIEGRDWLKKIMSAYSDAIKEAKEKNFHRQGYEFMGQIIFVTAKKGYMQQIDVDANTVYNNYMESKTLKKYFDELGLTDGLLAGEPNKEN
jgi:hypothetical protein